MVFGGIDGQGTASKLSLEILLRHVFGGTLFEHFDTGTYLSEALERAAKYKDALGNIEAVVHGSRYPGMSGAAQFLRNHELVDELVLYNEDPDFRYLLEDKLEDIELVRKGHSRFATSKAVPTLLRPDTSLTELIYLGQGRSLALMEFLDAVYNKTGKRPSASAVASVVDPGVGVRDELIRRQRKRGFQFVDSMLDMLATLPSADYENPTFSPRLVLDRADYYNALVFNILPKKYQDEFPQNFIEGLKWTTGGNKPLVQYPLDLLLFIPDSITEKKRVAVDQHGVIISFKSEESAARKAAHKLTNTYHRYTGRFGKYTMFVKGQRDDFRIPLNMVAVYDMYRFAIVGDELNDRAQASVIAVIRDAFGGISHVRENAKVGSATSETYKQDNVLGKDQRNFTLFGGAQNKGKTVIQSPIIIDFHHKSYRAEGNSEFSGPQAAGLRRHQLHEGVRQREETKNLYLSLYQYISSMIGGTFSTLRELYTQTNFDKLSMTQVTDFIARRYLEVESKKGAFQNQLQDDIKAGTVKKQKPKDTRQLKTPKSENPVIPESVRLGVEFAQEYTALLWQYVAGIQRVFAEPLDTTYARRTLKGVPTISYARPGVIEKLISMSGPLTRLHDDVVHVNLFVRNVGSVAPFNQSHYSGLEANIENALETITFLKDAYSQIKYNEGTFRSRSGNVSSSTYTAFEAMYIADTGSLSMRRLKREIGAMRSIRDGVNKNFEITYEDSLSKQLSYLNFLLHSTALDDFVSVGNSLLKSNPGNAAYEAEQVGRYIEAARDFHSTAIDTYERFKNETLHRQPLIKPDLSGAYERNLDKLSHVLDRLESVR